MLRVDVIVGAQYGDEGKGKVTHHLLREGDYTHCVRYNGGCNAGHTIYRQGEKFVTHHIPAGVFFGKRCIIGPGCVVDIHKFFTELQMLNAAGINTDGKVYIAKNAHIIQEDHFEQDSTETRIGTTRTGNGPCYAAKYGRNGAQAKDFAILQPFLIDMYEEFFYRSPNATVLCEGAQGFGLDIDWGDYPYVTSSHCTTAGALLNGFPPRSLRHVYGVAKAYETYVGAKDFQPEDEIFEALQVAGDEFGATTGRKRQCNWLDLSKIHQAVNLNGVTHLVINKMDILEKLDKWVVYVGAKGDNAIFTFPNRTQFCDYISHYFQDIYVTFSDSPEKI